MTGKTVVITGASSGIGLETARELAKQGAKIVMVVRNKQRGEDAIASIGGGELVLADLYSLADVRKAGAEIRDRFGAFDVLVNNAGMIHGKRELTVDGFEKTFALNHLAAFLLTYELREHIRGRVVTVSSWGHNLARFSWDDLHTMNKWTSETGVYGASKLCNIWFTRELAKRMKAKGVTSNAVHPGAVASNFGATGSWLYRLGTRIAKPLLLTSAQGARTSVYLASSPEVDDVTGEYFKNKRIAKISKRARDDAEAAKLWQLSEQLCGVRW
jgi:NAD(P)-dependent dehydrogenase (short-subunit alcohol dehydrogenase family)